MSKKPSASNTSSAEISLKRPASTEIRSVAPLSPPGNVQRPASTSQATEEQKSPSPEPQSVYPLEQLQGQGSYKLPRGVDRMRLEDYLSDADFKVAFNMTRDQFAKLASWKQRDLKRRAKLF
jgi:hypothetical protein